MDDCCAQLLAYEVMLLIGKFGLDGGRGCDVLMAGAGLGIIVNWSCVSSIPV